MNYKIAADPILPRLRVRRLHENVIASLAASAAIKTNKWQFLVEHGGDVCNSYGYPADTECCLAISDPCGNVVIWMSRTSANKVTKRRAAYECIAIAGDLFDIRIKNEERRAKVREDLKKLHANYWPPLELLANAAED